MYNNTRYKSYNNQYQKGYAAYQQPSGMHAPNQSYQNNHVEESPGSYNIQVPYNPIPRESYQQQSSYNYHHPASTHLKNSAMGSSSSPGISVARIDGFHEVCVDLKGYANALYFEKLLQWGKRAFQQHYPQANYLLGEDITGYEYYAETICSIAIVKSPSPIANAANSVHSSLVVQGYSPHMVQLRAERIGQMVQQVLINRRQKMLSSVWRVEHCQALEKSDMLLQYEESLNAVVVFHPTMDGSSTGTMEVLSVSLYGADQLFDWLVSIVPMEVSWQFPRTLLPQLTDQFLDRMTFQHAAWLMVPSSTALPQDNGEGMITIYCFGFQGYADHVYQTLQRMAPAELPSYSQPQYGQSYIQYSGSSASVGSGNSYATPYHSQSFVDDSANSLVTIQRAAVPPKIHQQVLIQKLHHGTFSFVDREAGIFYLEFESFFRSFVEYSFQTVIEENMDFQGHGPNHYNNYMQQAADSQKSKIVKISFYANTAKCIADTRTYLEQFNATNLPRTQVFYPQVSMKKYKEIYNQRAIQMNLLNNMRLRQCQGDGTGFMIIDPLTCPGFVNIRMKPPMPSQGIKRLMLPADVTVTICGSNLVNDNVEWLKELEDSFQNIPSDFQYTMLPIPYNHPWKRQLTIKSLREELICKYQLVALKWEEGTRATRSVGIARIWAHLPEELEAIVRDLKTMEMENDQLNNGTMHSDSNSVNSSPTSTESNDDVDDVDGHHHHHHHKEEIVRSIIRLPELTLRYVLLGPHFSQEINALMAGYSAKGMRIKCPYREKSDPHAAILFEGEVSLIAAASQETNALFQQASAALGSIQLLVHEDQYRVLTEKELALVKAIQGQAGVHIKLDSQIDDNEEDKESRSVKGLLDVRDLLEGRDLRLDGSSSPYSSEKLPGSKTVAKPLLSLVNTIPTYLQGNKDYGVSLYSAKTSPLDWYPTCDGVISFVSSQESSQLLSSYDALRLLEEGILMEYVSSRPLHGSDVSKPWVRVLADRSEQQHTIEEEKALVIKLIEKSLMYANEIGLSHVAILAPTHLVAVNRENEQAIEADKDDGMVKRSLLLQYLTEEDILTTTVQTIMRFVQGSSGMLNIQSIACVDDRVKRFLYHAHHAYTYYPAQQEQFSNRGGEVMVDVEANELMVQAAFQHLLASVYERTNNMWKIGYSAPTVLLPKKLVSMVMGQAVVVTKSPHGSSHHHKQQHHHHNNHHNNHHSPSSYHHNRHTNSHYPVHLTSMSSSSSSSSPPSHPSYLGLAPSASSGHLPATATSYYHVITLRGLPVGLTSGLEILLPVLCPQFALKHNIFSPISPVASAAQQLSGGNSSSSGHLMTYNTIKYL